MKHLFLLFVVTSMLAGNFAFAEDPLTGSVELAVSSRSGNTDTAKYFLDIELRKKVLESSTIVGKAHGTYGTTKEVVSEENWFAGFQYDYDITSAVYGFSAESIERNELKGLVLRSVNDIGLGYRVIDEDDRKLVVQWAFGYVDEDRLQADDKEFTTSTFYTRFKWDVTDMLSFEQTAKTSLNFDDTDKYLVEEKTSITTKLVKNISVRASYEIKFDSKPVAGFGRADRTFRTSIVAGF